MRLSELAQTYERIREAKSDPSRVRLLAELWMNLLAPLARPLFKWSHDVIMAWGAEGLAERLKK